MCLIVVDVSNVSFFTFVENPAPYTDRGSMETDQETRSACRFKKSWLKDCSGNEDKTYGFDTGKPCLIVKLNKIVNFRPQVSVFNIHTDKVDTSQVIC